MPAPATIKDAHELLPTLRAEAVEVKQCFANFCFQALAFNSAVLAVIARYGDGHPQLLLASSLVAVLSIAVARIGTYKYATANRNYGFELFVDRISRMRPDVAARYTEATLAIGWEEALRAWRIVQASIFERLYSHRGGSPNFRSRLNRAVSKPPIGSWWDVESLVEKPAGYYPGSYLASMLSLLGFFVIASWVPLVVLSIEAVDMDHPFFQSRHILWVDVALFILLCAYSLWFLGKRRVLLESKLLSIHGCSIVWEVVVVAHLRAVREIQDHHFNGYSRALSQVVNGITKRNLIHIHDWLKPKLPSEVESNPEPGPKSQQQRNRAPQPRGAGDTPPAAGRARAARK